MGGSRRGVHSLAFIFLLSLASPLFIFNVTATAGMLELDQDSISIGNYSSFEGEILAFNLTFDEISGNDANLSFHVTIESLEGQFLGNLSSATHHFAPFEQRIIQLNVTGIPFGYSVLNVSIEGDVSTTSIQSFERIVQRLRPMNLSLAGVGSFLVEGQDAEHVSSGNLSLHDGDYFSFEFPLINQGDFNWSGDVFVEFENGNGINGVNLTGLEVGRMSSYTVNITPSFRLVEGILNWNVLVVGNMVADQNAHYRNGSFPILPPPLPILHVTISNSSEMELGESQELVIYIENDGDIDFEGTLICQDSNQNIIHEQELQLGNHQNITSTISFTIRPTELQCIPSGMRMAIQSEFESFVIDMPSAAFEIVGNSQPTFGLGPWHQGDTSAVSVLVRNVGTRNGSIRLSVDDSITQSFGQWVDLDAGKAAELTLTHQFLTDMLVNVTWQLQTVDGVITHPSQGQIQLPINPIQSVDVRIVSVNREDGETNIDFELELDEGKPRDVVVSIGYEHADQATYLIEEVITLSEGVQKFERTIQFDEGEKVLVKVQPENWQIGPGLLLQSSTISQNDHQFGAQIQPVTLPLRPIEGDKATVTIAFTHSGTGGAQEGQFYLTTFDGILLCESLTAAFAEEGEQIITCDVDWPSGNEVSIILRWVIHGQTITTQQNFVSGTPPQEESSTIPFTGIVWGVIFGSIVVMIVRIRAGKEQSSSSKKVKGSAPVSSSTTPLKEEKIEVACPECERKLRVPSTYSGQVGCPDCSFKFKVEAVSEEPHEGASDHQSATDEDHDVEVVDQPTSQPNKVNLACPQCEQTLRVPSSYLGSVRCPSCKTIFKAGETQHSE